MLQVEQQSSSLLFKCPHLTSCMIFSSSSSSKQGYYKLIYSIIGGTYPGTQCHLISLLCAYKRDSHWNLKQTGNFQVKECSDF